MTETEKAKQRREAEGFFQKYCKGKGIDIGCGTQILQTDLMKLDIRPFDQLYGDGDATFLEEIEDESFDYVYSSHCLEHISDLKTCIKNWWRVLKPGGYLLIQVPERDLYEKKKLLPSRWNLDHKHFFLLDFYEHPYTIGIVPFLGQTISELGNGRNYCFVSARSLQEEVSVKNPKIHSKGEYSIEIIIKKIK